MHRTVILEHTLPDSSIHYDWMIDQPQLDINRRLLTWSCADRPDSPIQPQFEAVRLADHRALYLDYEGDISNNRGSVRRLATGQLLDFQLSKESCTIEIRWPSAVISYSGNPTTQSPNHWIFKIQPIKTLLDE